MIGTYVRYTIPKFSYLKDAIGDKAPGRWIIRDTYEEAEEAAFQSICSGLRQHKVFEPVRFIHHPHADPPGLDPFNACGSWGWKTVE